MSASHARDRATRNSPPEKGWTLGELAYSVALCRAPDPALDRVLDLFLRGGLRADHMVSAAFAGWAVQAVPRYTADAAAVRAMAAFYGVATSSAPLRNGYEGTASRDGGEDCRECGATPALAELTALLSRLRRG